VGHRANYVVKTEEGYELYYSHWGANVIERDLFWGPGESLRFVRSQKPTTDWLDEVWCEGGACLDLLKRRLILFGGEDIQYDPFLLDRYFQLLQLSWDPWTVRWAYRGILDIAREVGVPDRVVLSAGDDRACRESAVPPSVVTEALPYSAGILQVDERRFTLVNDLDDILIAGPSFLQQLPRHSSTVLSSDPPSSGAIVQTERQTLQFWHGSHSHPLLEEWLADRWTGWRVTRREDLATDQSKAFVELAGRQLPNTDELLRSNLLRDVGSRALSLPSLRKIHGEEAKIELNPLATQDVRPDFENFSREQYLAELARRRSDEPEPGR
jgi:hypothetical protein